jgi:hypothetical protein
MQTRIQHESGGYLIRTNSLGFRSETEFRKEKTENKKRILLFGDSYTAADGVSNKMRYSDVLMRMLNDVEIYNFGMPGTGTDQQYLIYKEFAKDIPHDMVMIVVLVENIRRVNAHYRYYLNDQQQKVVYQKPYFELDRNELILKNVPVNPNHINIADLPDTEKETVDEGGRFPGIRKLINEAGLKELAQTILRYQPLPEYKKNSNQWLLMKSILLKWFSESNKQVLLVPLPLHQYVEEESDYSHIQNRFNEFRGIEQITVFDPINQLQQFTAEERRKFRYKSDAHLTAYAHETYANIFKPEIAELLYNTNG